MFWKKGSHRILKCHQYLQKSKVLFHIKIKKLHENGRDAKFMKVANESTVRHILKKEILRFFIKAINLCLDLWVYLNQFTNFQSYQLLNQVVLNSSKGSRARLILKHTKLFLHFKNLKEITFNVSKRQSETEFVIIKKPT